MIKSNIKRSVPETVDPNIQKYMAFVKTAEYGSFTKAAELLNYSQSGISRMIGDLEADWGVALFERGKSGVLEKSLAWEVGDRREHRKK